MFRPLFYPDIDAFLPKFYNFPRFNWRFDEFLERSEDFSSPYGLLPDFPMLIIPSLSFCLIFSSSYAFSSSVSVDPAPERSIVAVLVHLLVDGSCSVIDLPVEIRPCSFVD